MILYIDQALSEKETNQVEAHLSACQTCRANLEKLKNNLQSIMDKMELLDTQQPPAAEIKFIPPQRKKFNLPNPFEYWRWKPILKPAYITAIFLVLSLVVGILIIESSRKDKDYPGSSLLDSRTQFAIHSIKMEEQPAQTYIVTEQETKTTLVWVEKMQN
jgi:predicted anti-sigma-YlaC factor YlaD